VIAEMKVAGDPPKAERLSVGAAARRHLLPVFGVPTDNSCQVAA
jgi:hypothetical protein